MHSLRAGDEPVTGYAHESYVESLRFAGVPVALTESGGWLLRRPINDTGLHDAMGPYPLFLCRDWSRLADDIAALPSCLVTVTLVTDPFGAYDHHLLERTFQDVIRPFRRHYVIDLKRPLQVTTHHRRAARKGLSTLDVERVDSPVALLEEWLALYARLMDRHAISGVRAFSRAAFEQQLAAPGLVAFRATCKGEPAGIMLWYTDGEAAYYHLGAFSDAGYRLHASHALASAAIDEFAASQLSLLDLGGGAGESESASGLERFKSGWSNACKMTYLCGRVFDRAAYQKLGGSSHADQDYFPAYRAGEYA